jgi:hypothetical protein
LSQVGAEVLVADYDNEHLIICGTCEIIYLKAGPKRLAPRPMPAL